MIDSTALVSKPGLMVLSMREVTKQARSTGLALSNGLTGHASLASSTITTFMAKAVTDGLTTGAMKVNGVPIRCTGRAHSPGTMVVSTLANTKTI